MAYMSSKTAQKAIHHLMATLRIFYEASLRFAEARDRKENTVVTSGFIGVRTMRSGFTGFA
jgi:hypothetical protein